MTSVEITDRLLQEVVMKATTSGGKGGQNVNKVATRVELYFDIHNSTILNEEQKQKVLAKLSHRISGEGVLRVTSSEDRSQLGNREIVKRKFSELIRKALTDAKKRKASAPTSSSIAERLRRKKLLSEKKKFRQHYREE
jgi:ribosome-associated protein